ncbi:MAG TPA: hypothetical protein VNC50_14835 [Planctomycetia bacterium]|nr:hypothetical protein [Planctomycetia bacterium]
MRRGAEAEGEPGAWRRRIRLMGDSSPPGPVGRSVPAAIAGVLAAVEPDRLGVVVF